MGDLEKETTFDLIKPKCELQSSKLINDQYKIHILIVATILLSFLIIIWFFCQ